MGLVLGTHSSDGRICLKTGYFNNSLQAEHNPHPGRALSASEIEVRTRLDWELGGLGSVPSLDIAWEESISCFYFWVSVSFCRDEKLGKFSLVVGSVRMSVWKNSDLLSLNRPPAGRTAQSRAVWESVFESGLCPSVWCEL